MSERSESSESSESSERMMDLQWRSRAREATA